MEKGSAKKAYVKPEVTRNEPLVDITFGSATPTTGGTLTGTGGAPGGLITKSSPGDLGSGLGGTTGPTLVGGGTLDDGGLGGDDFGDTGTLTGGGSIIPGTGGAPGTVL